MRTSIPRCRRCRQIEAPKLAAHSDAIFLNAKLFQRVKAIYDQRASLKLDPESLRLVDWYYKKFVHSGANLSDADKTATEEAERRGVQPQRKHSPDKLLAATKDAAFVTTDKARSRA